MTSPHVPHPRHLTPLESDFPSRLRGLAEAPRSLTTCGGSLEADRAVAIVGSRRASADATAFAFDLAARLARQGVVVVSGGALGVDAAAHRGALSTGGRTWAVAGTGHDHVFPEVHAELFREIASGPGAMVWPFSHDYHHRSGFLARNQVLVALADAVVVVQAGFPSGALHAAACARRLGRPLWVVPAPPWLDRFEGSRRMLEEGARPLLSVDTFLDTLGLAAKDLTTPTTTKPLRPFNANEDKILQHILTDPLHVDQIGSRAGLPPHSVAAALLTLSLENVVVEGPSGFFRRPGDR